MCKSNFTNNLKMRKMCTKMVPKIKLKLAKMRELTLNPESFRKSNNIGIRSTQFQKDITN